MSFKDGNELASRIFQRPTILISYLVPLTDGNEYLIYGGYFMSYNQSVLLFMGIWYIEADQSVVIDGYTGYTSQGFLLLFLWWDEISRPLRFWAWSHRIFTQRFTGLYTGLHRVYTGYSSFGRKGRLVSRRITCYAHSIDHFKFLFCLFYSQNLSG